MLTPQEAESHVFQKASFGGYQMQPVDDFFAALVQDYRALYQENLSLKSKLKVLVDKVEEYRATEDAMRITLHSAQKMADAMVKEGQAKKQAALDEIEGAVRTHSAQVKAAMEAEEAQVRAQLEAVQAQLNDEQLRLEAARSSTAAYVGKLKELYTQELQYIGSLSALSAAQAQEEAPAPQPEPAPQPAAPQPVVEVESEPAQAIDEAIFSPQPAPGGDMGDTRVFDQTQLPKE